MESSDHTPKSVPDFVVHKVSADEWQKLADIRTRAIQDAPQAFGDTIENTRARSEEEWRKWTNGNIYTIEQNGRFVATVTWRKHEEYGDYIVGVWTDPDYRGKGLNKKLFEKIFDDAKKSGVEKISLHVNVDQKAAIQSYRSLGFEITGTVNQKHMGDGNLHDEYAMEKDLRI